jgi:SAM-dependent methyltransferase
MSLLRDYLPFTNIQMRFNMGKSILEKEEVRDYYKQQDVAEEYISKRFTEPINVVEHSRQVNIINGLISKIIGETGSCKVLEFAPGPARLTSELSFENIKSIEDGTSIDSSASMLQIARKRMTQKRKKWNFIEGDILNWKFTKGIPQFKEIDLVFCIRFILHFKNKERQKIYQRAAKVLKKDGLLVFEVMNKDVVLPFRRLMGLKRYFVYDKLYTRTEFVKEMEDNGFKVVKLYPVLKHFWLQTIFSRPFKLLGMRKTSQNIISHLEHSKSHQPYEWIALCQKE